MSTEPMDKISQEKMAACMREIFDVLIKNKLKMSESAGLLGGVFGFLACQTEENFPFVSFFNSFMRSYHANYEGKEPHHLSGEIKLDNLK